ncbi:F-box/FBD/LRR-repeat protein At1g13570 [Brachypodium distachyon]|uniref:F-box/LRR-repeat protein 15/At3g58940/PEG3-like LRR domain-containing protein n=1 Tax=Brachypodium distachyon TaxID=15368 RepID=I1HJE8_BRADI|nr:F-box/FBD/LRR-repeat protein At1g13570 [Brachypodium distachyon]KQK06253.1 hypothetical protein BRADI_2g25340v3 [Brachypodium distachyon]KQK06254.1 hypothetical protein BRADI_2g25340v3 [Brachypodium distachyon]PNT71260.1 hypothetical protein BRADI_2g25340v3 [Brachypodium distachyon]|eukprot:XP_014754673.1 F-box/FBD/LRR-repeat protein At1g13570 [Brachypodium distachyon]
MTELMFSLDDFASENGNADDGVCRFLKFTDMFLSLHNGPILKFGLNSLRTNIISTRGHIYRWMLMLSRNGIKEIQLKTRKTDFYNIPYCFFSCDELESVYLQACVLTTSQLPPLSKGFRNLHTLHLERAIVQGNSIGNLVASCPNLEELAIFELISFGDINIHSTKLKILTIDGQFKHLNLHTPYLASAAIRLIFHTGDASNARCHFDLPQFIASLLDVETVKLHGRIIECVEHGFLVLKPPKLFNRLTEITLEINLGNVKEANLAPCLFQHAPNLRSIVLKLIYRKPIVCALWESIDHQVHVFQNVDAVGMINFTGSCAELGFLKLLLGDAPVLRRVEIRGKGKLREDAFKKLLKMRRASKDAEIVVH